MIFFLYALLSVSMAASESWYVIKPPINQSKKLIGNKKSLSFPKIKTPQDIENEIIMGFIYEAEKGAKR